MLSSDSFNNPVEGFLKVGLQSSNFMDTHRTYDDNRNLDPAGTRTLSRWVNIPSYFISEEGNEDETLFAEFEDKIHSKRGQVRE
jgi:hypothetical protein